MSNSVTVVKSESDSDSDSEIDIVELVVLEIMLIVSNLSSSFAGIPARKSLQFSYTCNYN